MSGQWACNKLISPVCRELAIDWFLWYVENKLLQDYWPGTLISRLHFWDAPYQQYTKYIPKQYTKSKLTQMNKTSANREMTVLTK